MAVLPLFDHLPRWSVCPSHVSLSSACKLSALRGLTFYLQAFIPEDVFLFRFAYITGSDPVLAAVSGTHTMKEQNKKAERAAG